MLGQVMWSAGRRVHGEGPPTDGTTRDRMMEAKAPTQHAFRSLRRHAAVRKREAEKAALLEELRLCKAELRSWEFWYWSFRGEAAVEEVETFCVDGEALL